MSAVAALLKQKLEQRCTSLTGAFRKLDKSNTGFISPADFEDCLRDFNIRLTRQALAALVAKYDVNGDGYVSYQEVRSGSLSTCLELPAAHSLHLAWCFSSPPS